MAIGAFGEHGHHAVKLVVLPKRTVLEHAIIPLKLMVESLVMVPTKTKILAMLISAQVCSRRLSIDFSQTFYTLQISENI